MFYVYNKETGMIEGSYSKRPIAVSASLDYIETERVDKGRFDLLYVENGKVVKRESVSARINCEIDNHKTYLRQTDYIALKLAEADENKREALKQTYKDELAKRANARDKINELEEQLSTIKEK